MAPVTNMRYAAGQSNLTKCVGSLGPLVAAPAMAKCAKKNEIKHRLAKGGHDVQIFQHARQSLEKCTWFYDLNCMCSYICKIAICAIPTNVYHDPTILARSLNNGIIYASPCFMIPSVHANTPITPHFIGCNTADILDSLLDLHFPTYFTTSI